MLSEPFSEVYPKGKVFKNQKLSNSPRTHIFENLQYQKFMQLISRLQKAIFTITTGRAQLKITKNIIYFQA